MCFSVPGPSLHNTSFAAAAGPMRRDAQWAHKLVLCKVNGAGCGENGLGTGVEVRFTMVGMKIGPGSQIQATRKYFFLFFIVTRWGHPCVRASTFNHYQSVNQSTNQAKYSYSNN
jgi:hypothetical protein